MNRLNVHLMKWELPTEFGNDTDEYEVYVDNEDRTISIGMANDSDYLITIPVELWNDIIKWSNEVILPTAEEID